MVCGDILIGNNTLVCKDKTIGKELGENVVSDLESRSQMVNIWKDTPNMQEVNTVVNTGKINTGIALGILEGIPYNKW